MTVQPAASEPFALPDPRRFDPVRFPGLPIGMEWPPERFDFAAPWMREPGLVFERDSGGVAVTRRFEHMRMVVEIERAHLQLDIEPNTRDFLLLRLIPAALRFVESVSPGDPVPPWLRDEDGPLPDEHQLYAATSVLIENLSTRLGEEGLALCDAIRRVPPGPEMFEQAVARCITRDGFSMQSIAPMARRLQRLANAHARVLGALATMPDFAAMERIVAATHTAILSDRRWANDLLAVALMQVSNSISRPRQTAEKLARTADQGLRRPTLIGDLTQLIRQQEDIRDRLYDLATFWRRIATAWLAVEPATTDRRDIEALARNAARRLALTTLYRTDFG